LRPLLRPRGFALSFVGMDADGDGKVTEAGLNEIRTRMPFVDLSTFEENPIVQDFGNLLTVSDLCRYIGLKIGVTD
ncbi:MAG: hypothetical protein CMJ59_18820, partial [Planctomycetaceae bacterium]|nr:hypothetical protein [Planctomycetaceae bacterium]